MHYREVAVERHKPLGVDLHDAALTVGERRIVQPRRVHLPPGEDTGLIGVEHQQGWADWQLHPGVVGIVVQDQGSRIKGEQLHRGISH